MQKLQNKIKLHFKLPIYYNNGKPVEEQKLVDVKNYFIDTYGGLTVDSKSEGFWNDDGVLFTNQILEYSVFIAKNRFDREVKRIIPKQLEIFRKQFKQIGIFCYYHPVVST
ncbi:MAG: hypothetical protein KGI25_00055 [Thaumarchaeota archaeon]|nr:hypothetical protein [Nitrososphaerota archaeon]